MRHQYLDPEGVVIMRKLDGKYFYVPSYPQEIFRGSPLRLGDVGGNKAFLPESYIQPYHEHKCIEILTTDVDESDEFNKPFKLLGPPGIRGIPPIWAVE